MNNCGKVTLEGRYGGGGLFAFHAQMLQNVNCHLLFAALNHKKKFTNHVSLYSNFFICHTHFA